MNVRETKSIYSLRRVLGKVISLQRQRISKQQQLNVHLFKVANREADEYN